MLAFQVALHLALAASVPAAGGGDVAVEFESVPVGTIYGAAAMPPDNPGDVVLTEAGVDMSVETFYFSQVQTDFYAAEVVTADLGGGASNALSLNSIGVLFDFAGVGFPVSQVTFDFFDRGGTTNFAVNGGDTYILDPLSGLSGEVAPGVFASVNGNTITVTGTSADITDLQIGGQELVVDHIAAVPEPATLLLLGCGMFVLGSRRARARRQGGAPARL